VDRLNYLGKGDFAIGEQRAMEAGRLAGG